MHAARRNLNKAFFFFVSIILHGSLFCLLWTASRRTVIGPRTETITLELVKKGKGPVLTLKNQGARGTHAQVGRKKISELDLRPDFMKHPLSERAKVLPMFNSHSPVASVLTDLPRTSLAFDHLATSIGRNLDYPDLLYDHLVQGTASLNLWFDGAGRIDVERSTFKGSHIAIRGMLAHASRLALIEWYRSDAYRLKKSEFAEQHFIAEFKLSYTESNRSDVFKDDQANYRIQKLRKKLECAQAGGVDLVCLAMKTAGAIDTAVTDSSRIRYELLLQRLNAYDDQRLNGINASLPQI